MRKIIFGIRASRLARAQLDEFIVYLVKKGLEVEYEVKTIETKGDRDKLSPAEDLGQGVFVKELERALLSGDIDCALHSLKDIPVNVAEGTSLSCFPPRADERDCLVCGDGVSPDSLGSSRVALGSPRREAFMAQREPGIKAVSLRGNVDTRLRKLKEREFDAMVLAACGLKRMGCGGEISGYLDPDTFVPAAGQGMICAQTRQDDTELNSALRDASSGSAEAAALSERRVLGELGVGCRMPFGVFARFEEDEFIITAKAYIKEKNRYIHCKLKGPSAERARVTGELIERLKTEMGR